MALYPPIVASSMPAFNKEDGVKIYYTLSNYNTVKKDNIHSVHVTVRRQSSNANALSGDSQILIKNFGQQQQIDKVLNRYFVELTSKDVLFDIDAIYKVQLRFSVSSANNSTTSVFDSDIDTLSEWSTVCIIKPIEKPQFYIDDFNAAYQSGQKPKEDDENFFYSTLSDFIGVYKQPEGCSQILKSWRLRLLNQNYTREIQLDITQYTLADSGWVLNSANNYNLNTGSVVLSCQLPYELKDGVNYKLLFEIQTKNGYTDSLLYPFLCQDIKIEQLEGSFTSYVNEQQGYIRLSFNSSQAYLGNLLLRRTDQRSGFLKWEDLKYFKSSNNNPSFEYYDFTVESGIFYRYLVQKIDLKGRRGAPVYDKSKAKDTGIMGEWNHAFLLESTGNGGTEKMQQLKLKYDFQISSYKTNISESKIDTIGSKYPFIRRNGNMYYKSFPVTGTITGFMDEADLFVTDSQLFNNKYQQYKQFKGQIQNYVKQYDYTYERRFREKVEEFLYNAKPKLYKSMQEGNIFIKLMQVSLTPKNELGRLIYSFSATAYQIDEPTITTFNNYGLIDVGQFDPNVSEYQPVLSQLRKFGDDNESTSITFKGGLDIVGTGSSPAAYSIANALKFDKIFNQTKVTDFNINWLRLTIESDPYLIIQDNGTYRPYDDIDSDGVDPIDFTDPIKYKLYQIESTYTYNNKDANVYLGWLFYINGESIIVAHPNNIYQLKDNSFSLSRSATIIPAKDTTMMVDFRVTKLTQADDSRLPKNRRVHRVNGQLMGTYSQTDEIIADLKYKYKYKYEDTEGKIERKVNGVRSVLVDTEPGTVIYLRTTPMNSPQRFVVNETGELNFDPNQTNIYINQLRIVGENVPFEAFNDKTDISISSLQQIVNPVNMDLYILNNQYYCYYNFNWYKVQKVVLQEAENGNPPVYTYDIYHPVDAIIFHFTEIREDIF